MIEFQNVTKIYPNQNRAALESVDMTINKGEFVFLVGPSGSGKSTFLHLLTKEEGFVPGGISLHNMMLPHGPDAMGFESIGKASENAWF